MCQIQQKQEEQEIQQKQEPEIKQQEEIQKQEEQGKKIKAVILKIGKKEYNILRSFMDSSLKNIYEWNIPTCVIGSNEIMYGHGKKWELIIGSKLKKLWFGKASIYIDDDEGAIKAYIGNYRVLCEVSCIVFNKDEIVAEGIDPLNIHFISNVPFAYYISLQDAIDKMEKYRYMECDIIELE